MEPQEKPLSRTDLKRTLAADGNPTAALAGNPMTGAAGTKGGRRQPNNKKLKILQHQSAPLAPRLIAPLQARPRFASFASQAVKDVEMMMMTTSAANTGTLCMPPMPTNPHEIAREAMRITQEAMKKQKLQDLELQKQQQQQQKQQQQSPCSSTMMLLSPPPLMLQQPGGTFLDLSLIVLVG